MYTKTVLNNTPARSIHDNTQKFPEHDPKPKKQKVP